MKLARIWLAASLLVVLGCDRQAGPQGGEPAPDPAEAAPGAEASPTPPPPTPPPEASPARTVTADEVPRVSVADARQRVQSGVALLVCAYRGEERFRQVALEGSISYEAFEQRLPSLPANQQVIFY